MSEEKISANGNFPGKINFNTAPEEELGQVPGVGPEMAKRIVAARPFSALADLQRVSGIGPTTIERLEPYVTFDNTDSEVIVEASMPAEETAVEVSEMPVDEELPEEEIEVVEAELVEDLPGEVEEVEIEVEAETPVDEPKGDTEEDWVARVLSTEPETPPEPVLPKSPPPAVQPAMQPAAPSGITRGQVLWIALGSSLLAFLLAIALSLGVLAALNDGQLQYASPGQIVDLSRQVNLLSDQASTLEGDITGLRTRMDNLEPLGDRVGVVEQAATDLKADLATTADQVTELGRQADVVAGEIDALQTENDRFGTFFTGLQDLLNQVFAGGETP